MESLKCKGQNFCGQEEAAEDGKRLKACVHLVCLPRSVPSQGRRQLHLLFHVGHLHHCSHAGLGRKDFVIFPWVEAKRSSLIPFVLLFPWGELDPSAQHGECKAEDQVFASDPQAAHAQSSWLTHRLSCVLNLTCTLVCCAPHLRPSHFTSAPMHVTFTAILLYLGPHLTGGPASPVPPNVTYNRYSFLALHPLSR